MLSRKIIANLLKDWYCTIMIVMFIFFGTYNPIFSICSFFILALLIPIKNNIEIIKIFIFIMPLASIFKLGPGEQSFFTYLMLEYVIWSLIKTKGKIKYEILFIIGFALLEITVQMLYGTINITRNIKFITNLIFLFYAMKIEFDKYYKSIFISYILGIIVSSFIACVNSSIFKISIYIEQQALSLATGYGNRIRFSGLYGDCNYYTVNIIIGLCLLVILVHKRDIRKSIFIFLGVIFLYFSMITYSKSAFLMLIFPLILIIYSTIRNKKYFFTIIISVLILLLIVMTIIGKFHMFEIVLSRLKNADGLNALTTGRFNLWRIYLEYIFSNIRVLFFGKGISSNILYSLAPHNTYIDILYYLGIIVGAMYILLNLKIIKQYSKYIKRNLLNYSIFIVILCMYFFLSEIFYYDSVFHILIATIVYNLSIERKQKICKFDNKNII